MSTKNAIATAAAYGVTGRRTGTAYLYSEDEIRQYLAKLAAIGKSAYLRRRKQKSA